METLRNLEDFWNMRKYYYNLSNQCVYYVVVNGVNKYIINNKVLGNII